MTEKGRGSAQNSQSPGADEVADRGRGWSGSRGSGSDVSAGGLDLWFLNISSPRERWKKLQGC